MTLAKKQEQKRQETVFLLAWGLGRKPHLGRRSRPSLPQESSDRPTFMIVKSSKLLYFDAVYPERKYGREDINKETGDTKLIINGEVVFK